MSKLLLFILPINSYYQCMKKIICSILLFLLITSVAYAFTDVPYEHPHSTAISYLESNGIVEGYPDGTFMPDILINRVEFLKIILEGTNVPLDIVNSTNFADVDESEWYAPYIKKAKYEGWIQGYPDNTFRPDQPINKVEALKILGEVQNWDRLAREQVPEAPFEDTYRFSWYSPYAHFAKENDLLFDEESHLYPEMEINRGYMAELVYQTIMKDVIRYEPEKSVEEKIAQIAEIETPDTYTEIDNDYFDNIQLSNPIPNTFYKNEVYILSGQISETTETETVFAFLAEDLNGDSDYTHFIGELSGSNFEIPIVFRQAGDFQLGIIPDKSGQSKLTTIHVLDGIPKGGNEPNDDIPDNLDIKFENDSTTISWNSNDNDVYRVYFIQEDEFHSYFVRNAESLEVFYSDFWKFEEGEIKWRVLGAKAESTSPISISSSWAESQNHTFEGITHHFKLIDENYITHSEFPEIMASPQTVSFTGTTYTPIFTEAAVIKPDGMIDYFTLESKETTTNNYNNEIIPENASFSASYTPEIKGTHILEINNLGGAAIMNIPIYIGSEIPIIPDFFDLQDPFETTENLNLEQARLELLNYINVERINHGLKSVEINEELNILAQNHTDDMHARYFFSHVNPDGETPNDRRLDLGIPTKVGENLAHSPSLYFAHNALMRSAIHRENILNDNWDTVGLGITLDDNDYLLVAEEFSHNPFTNTDLENFENDILSKINSDRTQALNFNSTLREIARDWSQTMIDENFFSFSSPSGINLIDIVQSSGVTNDGNAYILKNGSVDSFYQNLVVDSDIANDKWNQVGIGIKSDAKSNLYLTIIYVN